VRRLVTWFALALLALAPASVRAEGPPLVEVTRLGEVSLRATSGAGEGHARRIAPKLGADLAALQALLGQPLQRPVEIRVGVGREQLRALAPPGRPPPTWAAGVAYPDLGLVLLDAAAAERQGEAHAVLRHELAHVALGQLGEGRVPRWFTEGFAVVVAGEVSLTRTTVLARAVATRSLIELDDLERGWPNGPGEVELAYAQSASVVSHLAGVQDGRALQRLLGELRAGAEFHDAFRASFGAPVAVEELEWRRSLQGPVALLPLFVDGGWLWVVAALLAVLAAVRSRQQLDRRISEMEDLPLPDDPGALTPVEQERLAQFQLLAGLHAPAPPPMAGPMLPPEEERR